jgi:hypothetical protein
MKAERSESDAVKRGRLIEKGRDESIDGMQTFISATKHKAQKATAARRSAPSSVV